MLCRSIDEEKNITVTYRATSEKHEIVRPHLLPRLAEVGLQDKRNKRDRVRPILTPGLHQPDIKVLQQVVPQLNKKNQESEGGPKETLSGCVLFPVAYKSVH